MPQNRLLRVVDILARFGQQVLEENADSASVSQAGTLSAQTQSTQKSQADRRSNFTPVRPERQAE
jgi:hypothetical protein